MFMRTVRQLGGARWLPAGVIWWAAVFPALGWGAPQVNSVSPRGLQSGGTTVLAFTGSDLLPEPRLLAPLAIRSQQIREGASRERVEIEVTLADDVAPGIYPIRLATAAGISELQTLGVDRLPQVPLTDTLPGLPVAATGSLTGSTIVETKFNGAAGQRVVVDVEARRLGGSLNPVVRLLDAQGTQLAWSDGLGSIFGDARLEVELPSDGEYRIQLHDALYRGAAPGFFRLKVGALYYADLAFPLGVQRDSRAAVALLRTNLPRAIHSRVTVATASPHQPLRLLPAAGRPELAMFTGAAPVVLVSDLEEAIEAPQSGDALQTVKAPVAINGRIAATGEEDRYRLEVTPGLKLRFDVFAARAGSPLDGVLTIYNEQGEKLADNDDRPGTSDPGLDFDVPAETSTLIVSVKDLLMRGGDEYVYRVAATAANRPGFSLTAFTDRAVAPAGGATVIRVRAQRSGYDGPIQLSLANLPDGVTVSGDEIPAGATDTLVTLAAAESAPAFVLSSIVGEAVIADQRVVRTATLPRTPAAGYQPWLAEQLAMGVTRSSGFHVAWDDWSRDDGLPLAAALETKVRIARGESQSGNVRLRLLTSQIVPKKEVDKKQVDDLDRALRLAGEPMIAADQSETVARVLVPGDLPDIPFDLAVQAELLSEDGQQVLATATTPAMRRKMIDPSVKIVLDGSAAIEVKTGVAPTARLKGHIRRETGFDKPVAITLAGLPDELSAPAIIVPGDSSEFELPLMFPYTSPLGQLEGVRLVGETQLSAERTLQVDCDVPLQLTIVAGGPPPGLFPVFEDEPTFVTALNQGDGQGTLETEDRYTGSAAYRVTPVQRYREELPGLGVQIAEHPGDGEYRYLRFAWKKRGGENILLQLRGDGRWGPSRDGDGAALRYEAGPGGNPFRAAAVKLDEALPEEWTVVTRDLYADFGAFRLDGLALTASDGDAALFDHVYLARSESELQLCPRPEPADEPLALFEDQPEFAAALTEGGGGAQIATDDKYSGEASVRVTPDQRYNPALPGLGMKIRENPGPGEYRYLRFAWKKQGGQIICLQINHDGRWGPAGGQAAKFRYDAGPRPGESYGAAVRIDEQLPTDWTVVTRDLFQDFGEFTFTGLALSPQDGEAALFDHIYLSRSEAGLDSVNP